MMVGLDIIGCQDFILGAGARFQYSRDLRIVVIRETPGVAHMTCWLGSSLVWCISI
jgi:hypothetical protein